MPLITISMYFRYDRISDILDLLRNENPVELHISSNTSMTIGTKKVSIS